MPRPAGDGAQRLPPLLALAVEKHHQLPAAQSRHAEIEHVRRLATRFQQETIEIRDYPFHADTAQVEVVVDFERSRFTTIMGPSGSGKSTLMKSMIGVMPLRSGSIGVGGVDVTAMPSHKRVANGLAYVPQGRQIFAARSRRALATTETELKLIAAAATIGLSRSPNTG